MAARARVAPCSRIDRCDYNFLGYANTYFMRLISKWCPPLESRGNSLESFLYEVLGYNMANRGVLDA